MHWQENLRLYIDFLKEKYGATDAEIERMLTSVAIPAEAFANELTPLQAAAHFLTKHHSKDVSACARILGRSPAEIEKFLSAPAPSLPKTGSHFISAGTFADRARSASEHLVFELEAQGLRVPDIARLLKKAEPTIWTLHYRNAKISEGGA